MLKNVPCGDQFPLCHYIKDAHEAKNDHPVQDEKVRLALEALEEEAEKSFKDLDGDNILEKIRKLEEVSKLHSTLVSDLRKNKCRFTRLRLRLSQLSKRKMILQLR